MKSTPIYVGGAPDAVFATLHTPAPQTARDTAVVLCPPFAWAEVCSYRALRDWAGHLAQDGYTTLRISLPSTGDSGGSPRDARRLEAWCGAVAASCKLLRSSTGADRVAAIGIGLGGLLASTVAATDGLIDELVLWSTPARGRALVRELKATARLETARYFPAGSESSHLPEGALEASGFLIAPETAAALNALDLGALTFAGASVRRALLLERDGMAVDQALHELLRDSGIQTTVAPGHGYAAMTTHPQQTQPPLEVFARTAAWLNETSAPAPRARSAADMLLPDARDEARIEWQGGALRERPVTIEQPFGRLSAILSEPLDGGEYELCAVLLNAGAIRRIGPGRMWVEAARRWALRGLPTLRLDVEGLGDADGDGRPYARDGALHVPKLVSQVQSALDALGDLGLGERFAVGGLCSGAYWSFHAALQDPRVVAAYMLNSQALYWEDSLGPSRDFRRNLMHPSKWRRLRAIPRSRYRAFARWAVSSPGRLAASSVARARRGRPPDRIALAFDQLYEHGKSVLMVFSEGEPLYDELSASGHLAQAERWPNMTIERVVGHDHVLRPLSAQSAAHKALDRAIGRELALAEGRVRAARTIAIRS